MDTQTLRDAMQRIRPITPPDRLQQLAAWWASLPAARQVAEVPARRAVFGLACHRPVPPEGAEPPV